MPGSLRGKVWDDHTSGAALLLSAPHGASDPAIVPTPAAAGRSIGVGRAVPVRVAGEDW
jgi:hypothetical protein